MLNNYVEAVTQTLLLPEDDTLVTARAPLLFHHFFPREMTTFSDLTYYKFMAAKEKLRCPWCLKFDQYIQYHDEEWGKPIHDDLIHFEFLILEGAQAGLSWATVLKKREGYRKAFAGFDPVKVARFTPIKIEKIITDPGIIRNRLKVQAAVNNAKRFLEVQKEFGTFDQYIWSFVGGKPIVNKRKTISEIPATTEESDALSKDLIKRGFKFVGSTVIYSHMQACGLVNDHLLECWRYKDVYK